MGIASVGVQFTIIDLLSKGVDRIKGRMESLAHANKDVQNSYDGMAKSAKYAAGAAVLTRELYKGVKPAVGMASDLQAELLGTRAELAGSVKEAGALDRQLKQVKATAFSVQAWTPFDMGQIVALEKQLLKSGAKLKDVTGAEGAAAASAALGVYQGIDPVDMGKDMIGIASPFKIQGAQFMDLADKIARASAASTVGAADIAETAKYAAPAMAGLNREVDEMLVLSAMMAKRGLGGSMGGTGIRQFFVGATKNKAFRNAEGDLKSLNEIVEILKKNLGGLGDAEQYGALTKLFDMRGAPLAQALMEEGDPYAKVKADMAGHIPLMEKLQMMMGGFGKQQEALTGTSKSTIADLFQPALVPLTYILNKTNEFVALLGTASMNSEALGQAVSGISLGGLATGAAATIGLTGAALYHGRKVLKGVGGLKGLLGSAASATAGIATGKAVQAATGVQPVFVTNWPGGFMPGGGGSMVAEVAAGAAGGGIMKKMLGKAGALAKGAMPLLGKAGMVGAAGAGGYLIGTGINKLLAGASSMITGGKYGDDGWLGDMLYDLFNREQEREVKNDIELNVSIDERGRVVSETNDRNTRANVKPLNRGEFGTWQTAGAH
ncbi:MAG: phage tail tape measure protein [Desulfobulbaceae bacterium]|nr:phage tail tape measure protein [Desulfobulbaceae bacterium]